MSDPRSITGFIQAGHTLHGPATNPLNQGGSVLENTGTRRITQSKSHTTHGLRHDDLDMDTPQTAAYSHQNIQRWNIQADTQQNNHVQSWVTTQAVYQNLAPQEPRHHLPDRPDTQANMYISRQQNLTLQQPPYPTTGPLDYWPALPRSECHPSNAPSFSHTPTQPNTPQTDYSHPQQELIGIQNIVLPPQTSSSLQNSLSQTIAELKEAMLLGVDNIKQANKDLSDTAQEWKQARANGIAVAKKELEATAVSCQQKLEDAQEKVTKMINDRETKEKILLSKLHETEQKLTQDIATASDSIKKELQNQTKTIQGLVRMFSVSKTTSETQTEDLNPQLMPNEQDTPEACLIVSSQVSAFLENPEEPASKKPRPSAVDTKTEELQNTEDKSVGYSPAVERRKTLPEAYMARTRSTEPMKSLDVVLKDKFGLTFLATFSKAEYLSVLAQLCNGTKKSDLQYSSETTPKKKKRSGNNNYYQNNQEIKEKNKERTKKYTEQIQKNLGLLVEVINQNFTKKSSREKASTEITTLLEQAKSLLLELALTQQESQSADQVSEQEISPGKRSTPRKNAGVSGPSYYDYRAHQRGNVT